MDKCDQLLPEHFRFVKGIVDSQDLSLNISRELLQHDRQLQIISKNIEKKIKSELKKLLTSNMEKYKEFWKLFGLQIKYGVVSEYGMNKEMLQDLLLFYSSKTGELTTLADYVSRMTESQKYIYYVCGSSIENIDNLPQTELCKEKGYEMLYLTDEIDEFTMQTLMMFEEKQFKAVDAEDAELQSEEEKEQTKKDTEENTDLLTFVKEALGEKVGEVVISNKLKSHPVCLSSKGPVTFEMEKYFAQMPGSETKPKAVRVLELNSNHKAFTALKQAFQQDKEKAKKYANIMYSQAILIAGFPLEDTVNYCDMVCDLM